MLHSSFCYPYLLLTRGDATIQLLKADASGELEEVESGHSLKNTKWLSACLYGSAAANKHPLCFLLSDSGGLTVCHHWFGFPDAQADQLDRSSNYLTFVPQPIKLQVLGPYRQSSRRKIVSDEPPREVVLRSWSLPTLVIGKTSHHVCSYEAPRTRSPFTSPFTTTKGRLLSGLASVTD